ncbi:hypothetical protein I6E29_09280 [Arcanobacterium haemolyticum]|nr:hypothetical protein [Arcanobacterium haemolyticum]
MFEFLTRHVTHDNVTFAIAIVGFILGLWQAFNTGRAKRRAQAEKINAWWVRVDFPQRTETTDIAIADSSSPHHSSNNSETNFAAPPLADAPRYYVGIFLQNSSPTPIRDLVVHSRAYRMVNGKRDRENLKDCTLHQPLLVSGDYLSFAIDDRAHGKTSPRPWTYPEDITSINAKIRPIVNDPEWHVTDFSFTDSAGRRWVRRSDGRLRRVRFARWRTQSCPRERSVYT